MKNIWFINEHDLPPEFSKFRRRYDMCKYLMKKGKYNLHIICGSFMHGTTNRYAYGEKKSKEMMYNGVDVHILRGHSYSSTLKRIFSMVVFGIKIIFFKFPEAQQPDLIYASSPHLFAALGALILAKRKKVKFILELRDLWPETWIQMGIIRKNGIIHKFFLILEKYLYVQAYKIINLDPQSDYLINMGVDEKKIYFVSNGVDLEEFDKERKLIIPLDEKKFNITYTGAIGVANNLEVVIKLAKEIGEKNICFNIIGYGPLKEKLELTVQEEGLQNVIFYDAIEKKDVPEVLRRSDILIMALLDIDLYQNGGSFNKLFEYFASKKPILFYGDVSPDYVEISNSGISVKGKNVDDFKDACLKLYDMSEEERNILGLNGRKYVAENFDWKILADKVDSILEETLQ